MTEVLIAGKRVKVGDEFKSLSPQEQQKVVDEIAIKAGLVKPEGRSGSLLDTVDAAVRGAADTMTFGLADEFAAGMGALTGIGGEFGQYGKNLAAQRGIDKYDEIQNPYSRLGGQVAGGLATARMLPSASTITGNVGLGALAGGLYGYGSGQDGIANRAENALGGAIIGGVVGGAADAGLKGLGKVYQAGKKALGRATAQPLAQGGALTGEGEAVAELTGFDPSRIAGQNAQKFAAQAGQAGVTLPTARTYAAQEFGIPLSRGQATGDVGQWAFEEAARNEARGAMAGNLMRSFDERQLLARRAAEEQMRANLAGGRSIVDSDQAAGAFTLDAVRNAATNLDNQVGAAYDAVRQMDLAVGDDAVSQLPSFVRRSLEARDIPIDDVLTPAASRAIKDLERLIPEAVDQQGGPVVPVDFKKIETARRRLLSFQGAASNGTDALAVREVKQAFDNWLDDAVDNSLFSGDPAALEAMKAARKLRAEYGAKFEARPGVDDSQLVQKMIDRDVTAVEVSNWLYGSTQIGRNGQSVRLAKRLKSIFGENSDEWNAIRQGALTRALSPTGKEAGPQQIASSLRDFLNGKGSPLSTQLFTPAERTKLAAYARLMETITPPPGATNPSKSAYAMARLGGDIASMMNAGDLPLTARIFMKFGGSLTRDGRAYSRARKATQGYRPSRPTTLPIAGGLSTLAVAEDGQ